MSPASPPHSAHRARSVLLTTVLLLTLVLARAAIANSPADLPGFECPASCLPPDCFCATTAAPGDLAPSEVPQFVLLTYDDAIQTAGLELAMQTLAGLNPNGCPRAATFFVNTDYTDFWETQRLYAAGHEIANHTMSHRTGLGTSAEDWLTEIRGANAVLSVLAGVPEDEIRGFRAPYLETSDETFAALQTEGFLYDSSIPEGVGGLSQGPGAKIWPYTLDFGAMQECWAGACTTAAWPGLFEVPMWTLEAVDGSSVATMDPAATGDALEMLLRSNFGAHYEGNRAPFGVFVHAAWLLEDPARVTALQNFFDWAAAHENVWFVTMHRLLEWMRAPVPAGDFDLACAARTHAGVETCDGADNDGDGDVDEGLVQTCAYPEGRFRTCSACPAAWPTPDLPLSIAVPITGGSMDARITQDWGGGFCAELHVVNDGPEPVVDWRLEFDLLGAAMTSSWLANFRSDGQRLTVEPLDWNARIEPDGTVSAHLCATRSDEVDFAAIELQLYGIGPGIPGIDDASPPPEPVPNASLPGAITLIALLLSAGARRARAPLRTLGHLAGAPHDGPSRPGPT